MLWERRDDGKRRDGGTEQEGSRSWRVSMRCASAPLPWPNSTTSFSAGSPNCASSASTAGAPYALCHPQHHLSVLQHAPGVRRTAFVQGFPLAMRGDGGHKAPDAAATRLRIDGARRIRRCRARVVQADETPTEVTHLRVVRLHARRIVHAPGVSASERWPSVGHGLQGTADGACSALSTTPQGGGAAGRCHARWSGACARRHAPTSRVCRPLRSRSIPRFTTGQLAGPPSARVVHRSASSTACSLPQPQRRCPHAVPRGAGWERPRGGDRRRVRLQLGVGHAASPPCAPPGRAKPWDGRCGRRENAMCEGRRAVAEANASDALPSVSKHPPPPPPPARRLIGPPASTASARPQRCCCSPCSP